MFTTLGRFVYKRRRWVLAATAIFVVFAALWGSGLFNVVKDGGFFAPDSESARATETLEDELGHDAVDLVVVYRSDEMTVRDRHFAFEVQRVLDDLPEDRVKDATSYLDEDLPKRQRGAFVSTDQHATYVPITLEGSSKAERTANYEAIKDELDAGVLETDIGGSVALMQEMSHRAEQDVVRAEMISLPILLVLLVVIFGSAVAASLPVIVGGLAVLGSLTLLRALAYFVDISVFSVNVATILGLGLAIDYGLFMVSRFREELARTGDVAAALPPTLANAGRTVAFSGVTVMIAFAGLLFFPQMMLRSIGFGGIAVVLFDLVAALVVLPAILAVLGRRVDALQLPWQRHRAARAARAAKAAPAAARSGAWARLAHSVMRRPVLYLVAVLAVLVAFGTPLLQTQLGSTDQRYLPEEAGARQAMAAVENDFPVSAPETLEIAVTGEVSEADLADYTDRLAEVDGAKGADLVRSNNETAHVSVSYEGEVDAPETSELVRDVRDVAPPEGTEVLVGGFAAQHVDNLDAMMEAMPWTIAFVAGVTLVLLFLAFGSVVLPVKAVLMGFMSLSASLGVVIWGFQEGHLAGLLGFDAVGTIDPTNLVLILIVAFGLAMDYELFLLSRIREEYRRTGDNAHSVAIGLQHTGQIITSAAMLLMVVLLAMGTSSLLMLKIIGIGLAIAVLVDATLVRALLVPATMRLLGRANWWLPQPLRWLHDRIGITEGEEEEPPPEENRSKDTERRDLTPVG